MMLSPIYSALTVYRQSQSPVPLLSALLPEGEDEGVNDVRIHVGSPLLCVCKVFKHSLTPLSVFCRQTSDRQVVVSEQHYIAGKGRSGTLLSGRGNAEVADEMETSEVRMEELFPEWASSFELLALEGGEK